MVTIFFNDTEQYILDELDYIHEALYRRGIRRYMDFSTGLVGIKRGISWQSLRESLYIPARCGVHTEQMPSKEQVRRLAKHLERVGLIKIISSDKKLIFECVLATRGQSVKNTADTKPTYTSTTPADISKTSKILLFPIVPRITKTEADTPADIEPTGEADTPLISDITREGKRWASQFEDSFIPSNFTTWLALMVDRGFSQHKVMTPSVIPLLKYWVEMKLSIGQAKIAFACAEAKLGGLPGSPKYYDGFIKQTLTEEKRCKQDNLEVRHHETRKPHVRNRGDSIRAVLESCLEGLRESRES